MRKLRPAVLLFALPFCLPATKSAYAQDGVFRSNDGGGSGVLESIYVPNLANAPFSLTLHTEWIQTMRNGGTVTTANSRPILRDRLGRIYMERWTLVPKGNSEIKSVMTTIQVDDPVGHVFYQCHVFQKVCEVLASVMGGRHYEPEEMKSGPLPNGKGTFTHEDLGKDSVAGVPTHAYRDTTTINPGTFGNDLPMVSVREFRYSPELGFNLASTLDAPQVGTQVFTVTELNTNDPDPRYFQAPEGYRLVDKRKPATAAAQPQ